MSRGRTRLAARALAAVSAGVALAGLVGGCAASGSSGHRSSVATGSPTATGASATGSPTSHPTTLAEPPLRAPVSRSAVRATRPGASTSSAAGCSVPAGVQATQVVTVRSSGSRATVRACIRSGSRYVVALGTFSGHVGLHGVSAAKREGDLRTPAGVFPLRGGFGIDGNPGLAAGWFRVGPRDVWVDDPASPLYNTHQRAPADGRWTSAEPLDNAPAYNYAQVIGYNEARTPGRGSAIFLHVDHGSGTAGCVSLPTADLLAIFRWERLGAVIAIS